MDNVAVAVLLLLVAVGVATAHSRWRRRRGGGQPGDPPTPSGSRAGWTEYWRHRWARLRGHPGTQPWPGGRVPAEVTVLCLTCRGRGWLDRRERTLNFTGTGFADVENPPTMCETCAGSGRVTR